MNLVSSSIQWRCGVCNATKPVGTGGICMRCKKFTCNRHLNIVLADGMKLKVCSTCLTPDDPVEKGLRGMMGKLFG